MPSPRRVKYLLLNMTLLLFTASAMICLLASIVFLLNPQASYSLPNSLQGLQAALPSYLQIHHGGWWSSEPDYQAASGHTVDKDEWNLLYHLGGNGPWVEKVDGVVEEGIQVPDGCEVDMVHMVSYFFAHLTGGTRMYGC
jgi:acid phosphatase